MTSVAILCPRCRTQLYLRLSSGRAAQRKFDHEQALALLRIGATVSEVATAMGVSRQAVSAVKVRAERAAT